MPLTQIAEEEIRRAKNVPTRFKKEVHNAASWMFLPPTSLAIERAAKYLGLGATTFLKHVDTFGLTVLYKITRGKTGRVNRYFLISELREVKHKLETATMKDALRSAEDRNEYFTKTRYPKIKIRRSPQSDTG